MADYGTGRAIFEGIDQAAKNLMAIQAAKYKMVQDKEAFDLEKKKANLQIKELEMKASPEVAEAYKKKVKGEALLTEATAGVKQAELNQYQKSAEEKARDLALQAEALNRVNLGGGGYTVQPTSVDKFGVLGTKIVDGRTKMSSTQKSKVSNLIDQINSKGSFSFKESEFGITEELTPTIENIKKYAYVNNIDVNSPVIKKLLQNIGQTQAIQESQLSQAESVSSPASMGGITPQDTTSKPFIEQLRKMMRI